MSRIEEETEFKKTLSTFNNIKLTDSENEELRSRMMNSLKKNGNRKKYRMPLPILSSIVASFILILGGYYLWMTYENTNESSIHKDSHSHEKFEAELTGTFGEDVYLPQIESHSIGMIWIHHNEVPEGFSGMNGATVAYIPDEKFEQVVNEEEMPLLNGELIYTEHVNEEDARVIVHIYDNEMIIPKGEVVQIEDKNVYYQLEVNSGLNEVVLSFHLADLVYYVHYKLLDGNTEEEALELVESFIKQRESM
ncbi:hypothetical protein [Halalkalibacter okhensis]|uniref:DUF4367 domain-containing protein n=1 Tax=Halalkalibacter okhensis TaxID=333138 RepID=A0A0B0I7V8_9BACI|nr:hypothetical protein [Halalkalibacter okhensis]KHF38573.1 hypothetical protein LQ50_20255 [Halalkalibacter okhensis]